MGSPENLSFLKFKGVTDRKQIYQNIKNIVLLVTFDVIVGFS